MKYLILLLMLFLIHISLMTFNHVLISLACTVPDTTCFFTTNYANNYKDLILMVIGQKEIIVPYKYKKE